MDLRSKHPEAWRAACDRFRTWALEFRPGRTPRIDRRLAHKARDRNVLVARLERLHGDLIIGEMTQDVTHPFFYEHDQDHVPGLYLIEAARQYGTAFCHLCYDVDFGDPFVLDACNASFRTMAEKDAPVFFFTETYHKGYAGRGRLSEMRVRGAFVQQEREIGWMDAHFQFFEPRRYERFLRARRRMLAMYAAHDGTSPQGGYA